MKNGKHTVFVYGSLMKGEYNHDAYLSDADYLGEAFITGYALYDLGHYPGIKHTDEPCKVCGELYEVSEKAFDRICQLESNGYLYQCEEVLANPNDTGEAVPAEVFVYLWRVRDSERFTGEVQSWNDR